MASDKVLTTGDWPLTGLQLDELELSLRFEDYFLEIGWDACGHMLDDANGLTWFGPDKSRPRQFRTGTGAIPALFEQLREEGWLQSLAELRLICFESCPSSKACEKPFNPTLVELRCQSVENALMQLMPLALEEPRPHSQRIPSIKVQCNAEPSDALYRTRAHRDLQKVVVVFRLSQNPVKNPFSLKEHQHDVQ